MKLTDKTVAGEIKSQGFAVPGVSERRRLSRLSGGIKPTVPVSGFYGRPVNYENQ
jgi:hypothetical protein